MYTDKFLTIFYVKAFNMRELLRNKVFHKSRWKRIVRDRELYYGDSNVFKVFCFFILEKIIFLETKS
jgi:hypothetical protein